MLVTRCDSALAWRKARAGLCVCETVAPAPRSTLSQRPARRNFREVAKTPGALEAEENTIRGRLQITGLALRRTIIKEVRGHF